MFSDQVVIEEKIDGAIVGLWFENGEIKTQASGPSEQYGGLFKKWIDDHWYYLSKLPPEFTVWGEW